MLRLTDVQLPLDHPEADLEQAILALLGIAAADLISFTVFRRSYDARKKSAIVLIYTLDVEVRDEAAVLRRMEGSRQVGPSPDTNYRFVAQTPAGLKERPVVIGTGPC